MRSNRLFPHSWSILLLGSLLGGSALAQGRSVLTGTITDAVTRAPLAAVAVIATSPALQGEARVVTDGSGRYRIPQLPPGRYALRLEKASHRPYSRPDIELRADRTIRVNLELLPEALRTEEQAVSCKPAPLDVGASSTGLTISRELLRAVPLNPPASRGGAARTFEQLAEAAPQAQPDLYGVSLNGATSPENAYLVDGLSVADPAFGINGTALSSELIEEVNVVTSGYLPELGRSTGGVLSVTTRQGSNELRGSLFGTWTPGVLAGTPAELTSRGGSAVSSLATLHNVGDFGAELGGPIIKDQLWFYAAAAPNFARYRVTRSINRLVLDSSGRPALDDIGLQRSARIPGSDTSLFNDTRGLHYLGKLTYAIDRNHTLTGQLSGTPTRGSNQIAHQRQLGTAADARLQGAPEASLFDTTDESVDVVLRLNSSYLEKRLLIDATAGYHQQHFSELPLDGSRPGARDGLAAEPQLAFGRTPVGGDYHNVLELLDPSHPGYEAIRRQCDPADPENTYLAEDGTRRTRCPVDTWFAGGPGLIREAEAHRWQGRLVGTYLLEAGGRHVLKAGVDAEATRYRSTRAFTGGYAVAELPSGQGWYSEGSYGAIDEAGELALVDKLEATTTAVSTGLFVQDSWTLLDRLRINAGLRFDTQRLHGADGAPSLDLPSQLSPRVGAVYDPGGDGRSKVYASFARYSSTVPLDLSDRAFAATRDVRFVGRAQGCSPTLPSTDGATLAADNPDFSKERCASTANAVAPGSPIGPLPRQRFRSSEQTTVDPAVKPMSTDELVAGAELMVGEEARAGVVYTHRSLVNALENMTSAAYFIGNPGEGMAAAYPRATRDYDAITLFVERSFADGWLAQASYTLSRLHGNYDGLFGGGNGELAPHSTTSFDLVSLVDNQAGPLAADRPHQVKVHAARQLVLNPELAFTLGASYRGSSGVPIDYLVSHPTYGADEALLLPRGSGGRTPFVHRLDTRISLDYRLTDTNVATLDVDVFNLFNLQTATQVDETYSSAALAPRSGTPEELDEAVRRRELTDQDTGAAFSRAGVNPNFKNPTAYQQPRNLRLGLRVTF